MDDSVSQHEECNAYCRGDVHTAIAFYSGPGVPTLDGAQFSADLNALTGDLPRAIRVLSVEPAVEHPPSELGWTAMLVRWQYKEKS